MRLSMRVSKVEVMAEYGRDKLEVTCTENWAGNSSVVFRVDDGPQARRTYFIGRDIDIDITPRRA